MRQRIVHKVGKDGRIKIPRAMLDQLGLKDGDTAVITHTAGNTFELSKDGRRVAWGQAANGRD